jgi:hypothetical protein
MELEHRSGQEANSRVVVTGGLRIRAIYRELVRGGWLFEAAVYDDLVSRLATITILSLDPILRQDPLL